MNISLIGYRGAGKTAIGKALARKLGWKWVDIDQLIVKTEGKPIADIFRDNGEKYFRDRETETLLSVLESDKRVISTGGGVIMLAQNRDNLKNKSLVFYLKASPTCLYSRIKDDSNRPGLTELKGLDEVKYLLSIREPLYEECADFIIDSEVNNVLVCTEMISVKLLKTSKEK